MRESILTMFSGIITDVTEVLSQQNQPAGLKLAFRRPKGWDDLALGESIATDGVCLTIENMDNTSYSATLIPQTLAMTTFGQAVPRRVNLERALRVGDRISGHFVQGHIDGIGAAADIRKTGEYKIWISYPAKNRALVVEKGSIVVNGVALTVADVYDDRFSVALVPFTLQNTTLGDLSAGDLVNLEYDVVGKYIVNAAQNQRDGHETSKQG